MPQVNLTQNTPEWLEWRKKHICASDVPPIMGESEYATPLDIFKQKTGRAKEKDSNWAMQRGSDTEPKVRALYALENDVTMTPVCMEHNLIPYLGASLDGIDPTGSLILEIKYPGKEKHELALSGQIPECYIGQVQMQLEVSGAEYCDYVSFNGLDIAIVRVQRNEEYIKHMLYVLAEFWTRVRSDNPPPLTDRDFLELDDPASIAVFDQWKIAKVESHKANIEAAKVRIKELMKHPKILCSGVKVITVNRKSGPAIDVRYASEQSI